MTRLRRGVSFCTAENVTWTHGHLHRKQHGNLLEVVAAIISREFFGVLHWYEVPDFQFTRLSQLPWLLLLRLFSGVLGAGFLRWLQVSEEWFGRLRVALPYRPALAGWAVGLIALLYPEGGTAMPRRTKFCTGSRRT